MVGCVFLSQNWAPLVKKIYKWLAAFFLSQNWAPLVKKIYKWLSAFFCPKIGHHSLKQFTNGWLRLFVTFSSLNQKNKTNYLQKHFCLWGDQFSPFSTFWLFVKKIHKCLAAFFCPKIGHHSSHFHLLIKKTTLITFKKIFASEVTNFYLFEHFSFSLKKFTNGWLRFFCLKIGHHLLKKDFSLFFWPRKKSLFTPELENYQTKIFNSV